MIPRVCDVYRMLFLPIFTYLGRFYPGIFFSNNGLHATMDHISLTVLIGVICDRFSSFTAVSRNVFGTTYWPLVSCVVVDFKNTIINYFSNYFPSFIYLRICQILCTAIFHRYSLGFFQIVIKIQIYLNRNAKILSQQTGLINDVC